MWGRLVRAAPLGFGAFLFAAVGLVVAWPSGRPNALPQYTARSGRNCENCHVEPSGWEDPPLLDRLCTLSCSACHIDPAGGGLRTVSGMYFGTQTLPFYGATRRPWADRGEQLGGLIPPRGDNDGFGVWTGGVGQPTSQPTSWPTSQPASLPSPHRTPDSASQQASQPSTVADQQMPDTESSLLAWGSPLGRRATNSFRQDRYAGFNADPLLVLGGDFRAAGLLSGNGGLFFPMQFDVGAALHPVEHLTLYVEGALWGSQSGLGAQVAGEDIDPVGLHETFVMTHEWPGNSYFKAGRFIPPFGTRLDDHTAPVRRQLGFDPGRPSSYVSGLELGVALNYPYLNVAVFQPGAGQTAILPAGAGTGVSGVTGWRDLAWGVGGSGYYADTPDERRTMAGVTGYLNPWRLSANVPLTYLVEADWVALQPTTTNREIQQIAAFQELDWGLMPGLNLRLRHDYFDPDLDVVDNHLNRLSVQADILPYRYLELQLVARVGLPAQFPTTGDFIAILRAWL